MCNNDYPMGHNVVGTCSICGGTVTVPNVWFGVIPPVPTCTKCGATAAASGPVIPMVKNENLKFYTTSKTTEVLCG